VRKERQRRGARKARAREKQRKAVARAEAALRTPKLKKTIPSFVGIVHPSWEEELRKMVRTSKWLEKFAQPMGEIGSYENVRIKFTRRSK
jgi:hypothetical protein